MAGSSEYTYTYAQAAAEAKQSLESCQAVAVAMSCDLPQALLAATTFIGSGSAASPASIQTSADTSAAPVTEVPDQASSASKAANKTASSVARESQQDAVDCPGVCMTGPHAVERQSAAMAAMSSFLQGHSCLHDEVTSGEWAGPVAPIIDLLESSLDCCHEFSYMPTG